MDPSVEAISRGSKLYPDLTLRVGTAGNLEFDDNSRGFILFGFCLYLVDRDLLSRVVTEADRCLKNGGFIGITDFVPDLPTKQQYIHRKDVFTYKFQYEQMFVAFPHFFMIERQPFSHSASGFHLDPQERLAATVIYKNLEMPSSTLGGAAKETLAGLGAIRGPLCFACRLRGGRRSFRFHRQ
ncbi:class I SAM-dependent methyltransferase [Achromobacter insuavis]|uniref:class I SAM-dependent methyltransferase n=1 Tax=Achromobacter insuavis TaxID=1287735 RepID=UPI003B8A698A